MYIGLLLSCLTMLAAEDLPRIDPGTSAYQVSSHNERGVNWDGGFYLYSNPTGKKGLAGWQAGTDGAAPRYTEEKVHTGQGALMHQVQTSGPQDGWRSIKKLGSAGMNFQDASQLSMWVWPTFADGGADYGIRIESGTQSKDYEIEALKPGQWNHVTLDISDAPRGGVRAFWLQYNTEWGFEEGMAFYVDDIKFFRPDGDAYVLDDFETGQQETVLFDAVGPGKVVNIWGLGGHDLMIEVDGEQIVNMPQQNFFTGQAEGFPEPFVFKGLTASGPWRCISHWSYVPIGFEESCRISTHNPSPFYHVIAEKYRDASEVEAWQPDQDLTCLERYWSERGQDPKNWEDLKSETVTVDLEPQKAQQLVRVEGGGAIASIEMTLAEGMTRPSDDVRLWIFWEGKAIPDVEAPLATFFGAGVEWRDVDSLLFGIEGRRGYCYFPMPFHDVADVWVNNTSDEPFGPVEFTIKWRETPYPETQTGLFKTQYRAGKTVMDRDWTFLEAQGRGSYLGVVQTMVGGHYCEGDIRFYVDGSRSPAFYGTGSEDYYCAACWPNTDFQTPFHGTVGDVGVQAKEEGGSFYDYRACYFRVHLDAPVRFNSGIHCGIEHGGVNETLSDYTSLAFYYHQPDVGLRETDLLAIGEPPQEEAHHFELGKQSQRFTLADSFEGDHDQVLWRFDGIVTTAPLNVTLAIDPNNNGVRLRRVLDQSHGRQKVAVQVDGEAAGTWYDPDQNEYKRLAESDFEIPPSLTRGKQEIRVTFTPLQRAWTVCELRALCHRVLE